MLTRKQHTIGVSHGVGSGGSHVITNRRLGKVPATVVWSGLGPPAGAALLVTGRKLVNPVNALSVNMRANHHHQQQQQQQHHQPPPPLTVLGGGNTCPPFGGSHTKNNNGGNNLSCPGNGQCCSCCNYCCCDSPAVVVRHPSSSSSVVLAHSQSGNLKKIHSSHNSGGGGGRNRDPQMMMMVMNHSQSKIHNNTNNSYHHHHHPSSSSSRNNKTWRRRSRSKERKNSMAIDVRKLIHRNLNEGSGGTTKPNFIAVSTLEDTQAIRCAEFHPRKNFYAVGSNSKVLRILSYPENMGNLSENHVAKPPNVVYKRMKHHRGSIYCLGWSPDGNLLATGSNDKTVKLVRFDDMSRQQFSHTQEIELTMHDGTIRDVCFIEDLSNKSSLLVSGGAGDCKIYVTDCVTATPFQAFSGHSAPVLSLYNWGGVMFCSGSQDKSIRIWDLRTRGCVNLISPLTSSNSSTAKSAVGSVCVDPTGRLLVSGHEDSAIVLYDIRGSRQIQTFRPHGPSDVRSVRFSPKAYYLLSAGYDQRLMLTDLQGDLSLNLASVPVASHDDKIISGRWHPTDFSFVSTSADKTVKLWGLPMPTSS